MTAWRDVFKSRRQIAISNQQPWTLA